MTWSEHLELQQEDLPIVHDIRSHRGPEFDSDRHLADALYVPESFASKLVALLKRERQLIFTGPPGSGKTYAARLLATYVAGSVDRTEFLQLHPSYSYEDFIEGFRPQVHDEHGLVYTLRRGPLLRLASEAQVELDRARRDGRPENPYVLVLDEINRANLAKVFGELFFALEYRDTPVNLQYSSGDEVFRMPRNLWIVGTMNTADRSVARFDAALRRRFSFIDFSPFEDPISGVLRNFLAANFPSLLWLADLVDAVNEDLTDRRFAVGPSYFMRDDLTTDVAAEVWKRNVFPYLADRFEALAQSGSFDFERLRKDPRVSGKTRSDRDADVSVDEGAEANGDSRSDSPPSDDGEATSDSPPSDDGEATSDSPPSDDGEATSDEGN